jgi:hypothetical protein
MTLAKLAALLAGYYPAGVYQFVSRAQPVTIAMTAQVHGWRCFVVNGQRIHNKATFLQVCGAAMEFPGYVHHNWDAFEESVSDLSWAPAAGYLLLYDHVANFATQQPREWGMALTVLQEAVGTWGAQGRPFFVLLRGVGGFATALPRL